MQNKTAKQSRAPLTLFPWKHTFVILAFMIVVATTPLRGEPHQGTRKRTVVGGWSYFDPKLDLEICKVEIMKDHTYTMTLPNEESPRHSLSGRWKYEGRVLEFVIVDEGNQKTIERGRVANWIDNKQFTYQLIDGVKPAGVPGRLYEFRRD